MNAPSRNTAVAMEKHSKREQLRQYLDREQPAEIGETEQAGLRRRLAPISERYLREILLASGTPLSPLVEGVRQDSFAELERTLLRLEQEYACGGRERRDACRRAVIIAKDHAKLALRGPRTSPEKKAQKQEMILWMMTWLENPALFSAWVELRKQTAPALTAPECRR